MSSEIELLRQEILELRDEVARNKKQMDWLMQGNLSSKNVREIGGYNVGPKDFKSRDGDVGLSSANDTADPVRMWAGGTNKDTAPWRVTKAGKMHATGATIESQTGYPKVVIDPSDNLFMAANNANQYISIYPFFAGNTAPVIEFNNLDIPSDASLYLNPINGQFTISSPKDMRISSGTGDLYLDTFFVFVPGWDWLKSDETKQSIQQVLNTKANAFSGYTGSFTVSLSGGGTRTLNFSNGILVS